MGARAMAQATSVTNEEVLRSEDLKPQELISKDFQQMELSIAVSE